MLRALLICAILTTVPALPAVAAETTAALESSPGGWIDLLADAGPDLKGWTRLMVKPGVPLKAAPSQWSLDPKTHVLICQGDGGHEWLRFDRPVGDAILHVEWRFTPVVGKKARYNSGIYARNSADARIWHQAQTGDASGGYLFGESPAADGTLRRFNLSKQVTEPRVRPAGEWNTFEITCKGSSMSLWVNGATTCTLKDCHVASGHVGVEAEGYRIEFRNVKLKTLD